MSTLLTTTATAKTAGDTSYTLVTLAGQIDESNLDDFAAALDPLIGAEAQFLVLNLAALEFINSKVIGYLAATHGRLSETQQKMLFVEANDNILDILELVGLTQIVPVLPTEAEATRAMLSGEL